MERNWELIRLILLKLEELADMTTSLEPKDVEGYNREIVAYHMKLLLDAKLIHGVTSEFHPEPCIIYRLTWQGHEYLDLVRDGKHWSRIKKFLLGKGVALSFDAITTAAKLMLTNLLKGE